LVLTYSLLREFVFASWFFRCHWPSILKFSSSLRRAFARFEVARNPKTLPVSLCKRHGRVLWFYGFFSFRVVMSFNRSESSSWECWRSLH
jgi:hypothetical protein